MHYSSNKVYFSEGTHIWIKGAENLTDRSDLKLLYSADVKVTALTVDWLYQRIYYVSSGKVCTVFTFNYELPSGFHLLGYYVCLFTVIKILYVLFS